jgi:hypothetical protein
MGLPPRGRPLGSSDGLRENASTSDQTSHYTPLAAARAHLARSAPHALAPSRLSCGIATTESRSECDRVRPRRAGSTSTAWGRGGTPTTSASSHRQAAAGQRCLGQALRRVPTLTRALTRHPPAQQSTRLAVAGQGGHRQMITLAGLSIAARRVQSAVFSWCSHRGQANQGMARIA